MKQVLRKGLKEIVVDDVPDPVVLPHHVAVRSWWSLISSGTESAILHQEGVLRTLADDPSHVAKIWRVLKREGPIRTLSEVKAKFSEYAVLGNSGVGVIVAKHETVTDLEIGDRVAYGGEGTGHAEIIHVGRNLVARVPEAVPFEDACFTALGSIALHAVRTANISLGERVAVIGLGLIGQLIAQLARLQGGVVIATDTRPDRVALAGRLGANVSLVSGAEFSAQVAAWTDGQLIDCVIVAAAAKSAAPCELAVEICRDRGRIVDVGAVELSFPWYEMYRKEIQLLMSRAYGPGSYDRAYELEGRDYPVSYVRWTENRNMEEFLRLAAIGSVQLTPLVTHTFPLEDARNAYQTIFDPDSNSLAVLLKYPAASSDEPVDPFQPRHKVELRARNKAEGTLGVAVAGAGNLARWVHLPNLKKIGGIHLRAVHSSSGPRGKSYARRFGVDYCSSDYQEMLRDPTIDVVVITSRNPQHAPQALAALHAGKHVFVEKPMALSEEECRALNRAVEETGKQIAVGFNRRFAPSYVQLKKQLERRTGPAVLNCRINSPGISGAYWMADPASGGAVIGEACHFADLMYWLLGAEPMAVSAFSLPVGKKDPIGENNLVASFRFADGSIGNLTYCTVGSRTSGGEFVEVFAPGVGASAEDFKRVAIKSTTVRKQSSWFAEKGYATQLQSFVESFRAGTPPAVTVRDGARATIACVRMLESARHQVVTAIDLDAVLGCR